MCGISGIYHYRCDKYVDQNLLKSMTDCIAHRGPDDEGYIIFNSNNNEDVLILSGADSITEIKNMYPLIPNQYHGNLGFGFRRLSIIDLGVSGHQPMSIEGFHIVFNGEIYNYLELKDELIKVGYSFYSSSDTEVIINAYRHWGTGCLERFIGMWAFAIWDAKQKKLFCSRDRYGIKPFYYAQDSSTLYFGSEIKQLLHTPVSQKLNYPMIWRSMKVNALLVYDEETFYTEIKALKPGHFLICDEHGIKTEQYYSLNVEQFETSKMAFGEAVEHYKQLFLDSVKLQMRSDVEVGSCLSGGLDSSAIVCTAAGLTSNRFKTFSSYYSIDSRLDERKWIEKVVTQSSAISNLISPSPEDAVQWFYDTTYYNDLPNGAGFVSQYAVMNLAHDSGIKVLLDGQGSDELTAGYMHSNYRYFADLLSKLKLTQLCHELPKMLNQSTFSTKGQYLLKVLLTTFLSENALYNLEMRYYRFEPFNKTLLNAIKNDIHTPLLSEIQSLPSSRLSNFLFNLMRNNSIQTLLHYEDRMSMANSVESRVPFLDHRLVDFAFSLPSSFKVSPPYNKYIHRQAMKSIVPHEIYSRTDKAIFSTPFTSVWLKGALRSFVEDIFSSAAFRNRGIWNLPTIMNCWQQYLNGKSKHGEMLFNIIALEVWFRVFD